METKSIKDRVKKIMDEKGISVAVLSRATDIPSARIYKWYKDNLNPKSPDEKRLEKWLEKIEEVPHETIVQEPIEELLQSRRSLEKTLENLTEDKIKSTAIIERLVTLLEINSGVKSVTFSQDIPEEGSEGTYNMKDGIKKKRELK